MNILNGTEAFAAMMAGQTVLCRAIGELIEFDDIDQFPATIFAKPGYEFCIKIETIEVAGITFTRPLKLEEIQEGQDVYVTNTYGQTIYISEFGKMTCSALIDSINSGFVQRDEENAKLQLRALSKVLGRELIGECLVTRLGNEKPKKSSASKKQSNEGKVSTKPESEQVPDIESRGKTTYSSNISAEEVFQAHKSGIANTSSIETIDGILSQATQNSLLSEDQKNSLCEFADKTKELKAKESGEIETDHFDESDSAIHKFLDAIEKCQSDYELQGVERNLEGNKSKIHASEYAELTNRIQLKRESFFASNEHTLDLESLKLLQQDAENLIQYQQSLDEYIQRVKNAKTPAEANALVKYTGSWTEEQRKPLIDAINARLVELNPPVNDASLSVRISKAVDLTELDALEIDVSSCDEFIQPKLMELVHKRRAELDPFLSPLGNAS